VIHQRAGHSTKWASKPHQSAYAATQCNMTINYYTTGNGIQLFRSITIIYILYFYLAGAGVMPNLAATAAASLCAHPLRRRLAVPTSTTLLFSN
jgi:hypothetical protein